MTTNHIVKHCLWGQVTWLNSSSWFQWHKSSNCTTKVLHWVKKNIVQTGLIYIKQLCVFEYTITVCTQIFQGAYISALSWNFSPLNIKLWFSIGICERKWKIYENHVSWKHAHTRYCCKSCVFLCDWLDLTMYRDLPTRVTTGHHSPKPGHIPECISRRLGDAFMQFLHDSDGGLIMF